MSDLSFSAGVFSDLLISNGDIATDSGIKNAIILSIFCEKRVSDAYLIPDGTTNRRGWCLDEFGDDPDFKIGSHLWLLSRHKRDNETLLLAKEYVLECLDWMIEDGVIAGVSVVVSYDENDRLEFAIDVKRPGNSENIKYNLNWDELDLGYEDVTTDSLLPSILTSELGYVKITEDSYIRVSE